MKNCGSCKGYDLGWCVWKAKRTSQRDGGCSWYKEDLDRAMDGAARKVKKNKKGKKTK